MPKNNAPDLIKYSSFYIYLYRIGYLEVLVPGALEASSVGSPFLVRRHVLPPRDEKKLKEVFHEVKIQPFGCNLNGSRL